MPKAYVAGPTTPKLYRQTMPVRKYIAIPTEALPDGAVEFATGRIKATPPPPH